MFFSHHSSATQTLNPKPLTQVNEEDPAVQLALLKLFSDKKRESEEGGGASPAKWDPARGGGHPQPAAAKQRSPAGGSPHP